MMRQLKSALAVVGFGLIAVFGTGCGEKEPEPLNTKDLPENMVTKPGETTPPPTGNQFKNPRDAAGGAGRSVPQGR